MTVSETFIGTNRVYQPGDYITLAVQSPSANTLGESDSTTSGTFVSVHGSWNKSQGIAYDALELPEKSDGNIYVKAGITLNTGTVSAEYRMFDNTNATALTGTSTGMVSTGSSWEYLETPIVEYNDPGSGFVRFRGEWRNSDGATGVDIYQQRHVFVMTKVA